MANKELALQKISELVERFSEQFDSYKKAEYNETLTRRDFIDPFFKALGWDIDNENGYAEAYREVIHEDKVKVGKATKAPDYSFRLVGGKRLFFVEAKKPSVDVKDEIQPAYQVRRYGWSAKLPISIITDFEEFAVYDCTKKPNNNDRASVARIKYLNYKDYVSEFDFIWDVFSKERVLKGSFDKFIQGDTNKKGTATVDREFLQSLDSWRTLIAIDICKHNPVLDVDEINFIVQQTIDRLIFIRIAEDRSVEPYGRLKESIKTGQFYKNLFQLFKQADDKYNSGLFDFKKDTLSKDVAIDNKTIKTIVNELYYPECPYEFSVLSVEILGSAYEQFLGKQIKIDKNHRAVIEEKPDVRKAGGVYYTPQHIVDYIVKDSIGRHIEGKKPADVSKLKVIDPACGSGSFLIGAYQYLLDWHKDYYSNNGKPSKGKKDNPLTPDGNLTTSEKKRILLNNIFGVDLDVNAVEVTKLSLLLKCMEGETEASINSQLKLFNDRVLPTLDDNIKSGNSLIDVDFYETQLDFGEDKKIKPFSFKSAFPSVFKQGGFDVVIGNPPWGAEFQDESLEYIKSHFISAKTGTVDSYSSFIEKSFTLLKKGGTLGFIVPDTFLRKDDFASFREFLLKNYSISQLIETGPVFSQVRDTWCCIFIGTKHTPVKDSLINHRKISRFIVSAEERLRNFGNGMWDYDTIIPQSIWCGKERNVIGYKASESEQTIIRKIEKYPTLGTIASFKISRGEEGSKLNIKESVNGDFFMVIPEDVNRFIVDKGKPIISNGLTPNKLASIYSHPKIWVIRIQKMRWVQRIVSGVDTRTNSAGMKTLQSITSATDNLDDLFYLQAILSSKLINFWCINYLADDINGSYLGRLPIRILESKEERVIFDEIVTLTKKIVSLKTEIVGIKLATKREDLDKKILFFEDKLNFIICHLYGLTEEQSKLVDSEPDVYERMSQELN